MKYTPMKPGQGASPQQCPTGTHTHNNRSGNTGQGTQEQAPIYSPLHNAPIKPHKLRNGAGGIGIYPRRKTPHTGQDRPRKKDIKKPRPQGAGVCTFNFVSESQPTARTGKPAGTQSPFSTPPHTNRKRRVSVVLVYLAAISGSSFLSAAESRRELVTFL